jgi:hypothetical protein
MGSIRASVTGRGVLLGALLALAASGVQAQVFYSYPGAKPVTDLSPSLGLVAGFGDNVIRLGGFGRFNISSVADLGVEAMYQNVDTDGSGKDTGYGGAGIDGKYALMFANENTPLDASVQAGVGFLSRSDYLQIHVPFGGIASHDFVYAGDRKIVPFAGVYFVWDYVKISGLPGGGDDSSTDFDVEMRIGASAEIISRGSVFASLHAGNGTMFFIGFNAGL